jgi:hypothetical protein
MDELTAAAADLDEDPDVDVASAGRTLRDYPDGQPWNLSGIAGSSISSSTASCHP